jgi:hypothetical protein
MSVGRSVSAQQRIVMCMVQSAATAEVPVYMSVGSAAFAVALQGRAMALVIMPALVLLVSQPQHGYTSRHAPAGSTLQLLGLSRDGSWLVLFVTSQHRCTKVLNVSLLGPPSVSA